MTKRAKFLALVCAAAATPAGASTIPKAMVVDLQREDLKQLASGIEAIFERAPVRGRYDEPMTQDYWWGTVRAQGVSYQFSLANVRVTPEAGHLRADVDVTGLEAMIETMSFNDSGSRYCRNIPLTTRGAAVPVGTDVIPWVVPEDKSFHVATANTQVGLTGANFAVEHPEECHAIWGFNWLVRSVLPWTSGVIRTQVKASIEQQIAAQAEKLSNDYGRLLEVRVTLPVDAAPIPSFYANLGVWPDSVEVTPDHFKFNIGADVEFDPDPRFGTDETESLRIPELLAAGDRLPSYIGIARRLIEAVVREANDKGLFQFDLGRDDAPDAAELLSAGVVALIIPDAATRFDPEAPVELNFGGVRDIQVEVHDQFGPGGIPIIDFCLNGLRLGLTVGGQHYYDMNLDARLSVALGLDPATRKLRLTFQKLETKYLSGAFAVGTSPAPLDPTFNVEFLDFFVKQLNDRMTAEGADLMGLILPQIRLGSKEVTFLGAAYRDDYLTLDAQVK